MSIVKLFFLAFCIGNAACFMNRVGTFEYTYWSSTLGLQTVNRGVYVSDVRRTFNEAVDYCKKEGLELLGLYSSRVNAKFDKYTEFKKFYNADFTCLEEYTFIGGKREDPSKPWKLLDKRNIGYKLEFALGEPNNPDSEFCLTVKRTIGTNQYGLNDLFCTQASKFICEEVTDYKVMDVAGSDLVVKFLNDGPEVKGFQLLGQYEYTLDTKLWGERKVLTNIHISTGERVNYTEAVKSCAANGLSLKTLENPSANSPNFIKQPALVEFNKLMNKNFDTPFLFGFTKDSGTAPYRLLDGTFIDPNVILPFRSGIPTDEDKLCVEVLPNVNGVGGVSCSEKRRYVCESPLDFKYIDQPGFSSILGVTFKPRTTSCGVIFTTDIFPRTVNNGTLPLSATVSPLIDSISKK